jgi:DNA-binding MarR family transcriptional regulator
MINESSSSSFTKEPEDAQQFGPPLIGALLRLPWEQVQRRMLERLHEHGFTDLDAAHLIVFQYPGPNDTRPSELAGRLRISKQALGYLLGQLEQLGYLERRPDPHDQRGKRITVTPRGKRAIRTIRAAVTEIEAEWTQRLGAKRFSQLQELLRDINQPAPPAPG